MEAKNWCNSKCSRSTTRDHRDHEAGGTQEPHQTWKLRIVLACDGNIFVRVWIALTKSWFALEYVWNVSGFDLNVSVLVLIVIETFGMNFNVLDFMSRKLFFFYYLSLA